MWHLAARQSLDTPIAEGHDDFLEARHGSPSLI